MQLAGPMLSIAHLADPHLDGQQITQDRLTLVADYLKKLPTQPDLVVVSGDITQPHAGVAMSDEQAARIHTVAEAIDFVLAHAAPDAKARP